MSEVDQLAPDDVENHDPAAPGEEASLWAAFLASVQFLTRVPIATRAPTPAAALHRCPLFFPLVGGLIGIVTVGTIAVGCLVWPVWLAVLVALAVEAALTGAMHEDAVADFCDAFGGGWTREQVLAILKDSRIGTYGALALLLSVAIRGAATVAIILECGRDNWLAWGSAIVAAATIGRWVMVLAMVRVPPLPRPNSLTREIGRRLAGKDLVAATLTAVPFVMCFAYLHPLNSLVAVGLVPAGVWWLLATIWRRLGGMTGDCLGCLGYVSQVLVLLAAAINGDMWGPTS